MMESCGLKYIKVAIPAPEKPFSYESARMIKHIAKCNGLTFVCKTEIDIDRDDSGRMQYEFEL
jgi:hypothetical protein